MRKLVLDTNLFAALIAGNRINELTILSNNYDLYASSVTVHETLRNPHYVEMHQRNGIIDKISRSEARDLFTVFTPDASDWRRAALLVLDDMRYNQNHYSNKSARPNRLRKMTYDALILASSCVKKLDIMTKDFSDFSRLNRLIRNSPISIFDARGMIR